MDTVISNITNNKIFLGSIMLLTNIGGRFLIMEFPTNLEKLFTQYAILRYLVLFSIFFMATRDIKMSILLTLLYYILIKYLINEKSSFCIIKDQTNSEQKIKKEEFEKAKLIINKYIKDNKELENQNQRSLSMPHF